MPVPKVAIVGRPNVGKSSLLNWLAHKRISIVDPMAGVTRDRVTYQLEHEGRYFTLIDTGGIGIVDVDELNDEIHHQIQIGIDEADVILFVVDGSQGISSLDRQVSQKLRKIDKPKLLVVNKCDSPKRDLEVAEFFALADVPMVTTSVIGNRHQAELLRAILDLLPPPADDEADAGKKQAADPEMKLAIVGRRNVGKSTFINQLAETDRMIVSEIPGTTRDSVDVRFELDGKSFIAIDTPGVRKRKSLANSVEWYGLARAKRSIRRANVVLMFFDCTDKVSRVDKQLVSEIEAEYKPCIFVVNKWDLAKPEASTGDWAEYLFKLFGNMRHTPVAVITGQTGRNVKQLINLAQSIYKQSRFRVPTGELNRLVRAGVANWPPPMRQNRTARVLFATQVGIEPPTLVLKVNDPILFDDDWLRYLMGFLREQLPIKEIPIKLYLRGRDDKSPVKSSRDDAAAMAELAAEEEAEAKLAAAEGVEWDDD